MADVANYHKLSGLKHKSFILQFGRSGVQNGSHGAKIKVSPELCAFLGAPGKNLLLAWSGF